MLLSVTILSIATMAMAEHKNTHWQNTENIKLTKTIDHFTARMVSEVVRCHPNESVVLSAMSIMPLLAQTAMASVGKCQDELLDTIGIPNDNAIIDTFLHLDKRLEITKGIDLQMANKIYIAADYELNERFAELTRHVFNADVKKLDFVNSVGSAREINSWVEEQTNNRIKDLVQPQMLSVDTRALLVNAIYFKGTWKYQFNKDITSNQEFYVSQEKVIKVPTMYSRNDYKYARSERLDAQVIEIPYSDGDASMVIVLPNKIDGIDELEKNLRDPSVLNEAYDNMHHHKIRLYLPKFKIETTTDLKTVLENMNVKRLFSPLQARLDNLIKDTSNIFVSEAIQKAFIEVNEEGAEAAAANVFNFILRNASNEKLTVMKVNRPFYFLLKLNSIVLFSGFVKTFD